MSLKAVGNYSGADVKYLLNKMNATAAATTLGENLENLTATAKGSYSFAVSGGAVGDISLLDSSGVALVLPLNAVIRQVVIDVITAPTSAGSATVALKAQSAGDLLAATAIASVTGRLDGIPAGAAANMIKLTANRTLAISIAVAALTAGKLNVYIDYVISA